MGIGLAMKRRAVPGDVVRISRRQAAVVGAGDVRLLLAFDITGTMWIVSTFIVLGMKGMWVHWLWGFPSPRSISPTWASGSRCSGVMTGAE